MNLKSLLILLLFICPITLFAQSHLTTDSTVKIIAHWKAGETYSIKINSTSTDEEGKKKVSAATFNVTFSVLSKDTSGYTVQWIYTNCTLLPNNTSVEDHLSACLLNQKLLFKVSVSGHFKMFLNIDEIKPSVNKFINTQLELSKDDEEQTLLYNGIKQLLSSDAALSTIIAKKTNFYYSSLGYNYNTKSTIAIQLKYPNPLKGSPFYGTGTRQVTKLDTLNSICVIERHGSANADDIKEKVAEYFKEKAKEDGISEAYEKMLKENSFEFYENSTQQIDY